MTGISDAILDAIEQPGVAARAHLGVAEFLDVTGLHAAAQLRGHGLHAVADTEHRYAERKYGLWRCRGALLRH